MTKSEIRHSLSFSSEEGTDEDRELRRALSSFSGHRSTASRIPRWVDVRPDFLKLQDMALIKIVNYSSGEDLMV